MNKLKSKNQGLFTLNFLLFVLKHDALIGWFYIGTSLLIVFFEPPRVYTVVLVLPLVFFMIARAHVQGILSQMRKDGSIDKLRSY